MSILGSRTYRLAALVCLALLSTASVAPAETQEPDGSARAQDGASTLAAPETGTEQDVLLESLYQRLEQAETRERAQAVASHIERLWRASGSPSIDLLLARAMSLTSTEEYNLALALLDTVVISKPEFAEGWSQRAMVHFQRRDFEAALKDLRRVLALEPKHYRAMQGVAVILNEFDEKERALKAYRRVLDVHPHKKEARDAVEELRREVEGQDI